MVLKSLIRINFCPRSCIQGLMDPRWLTHPKNGIEIKRSFFGGPCKLCCSRKVYMSRNNEAALSLHRFSITFSYIQKVWNWKGLLVISSLRICARRSAPAQTPVIHMLTAHIEVHVTQGNMWYRPLILGLSKNMMCGWQNFHKNSAFSLNGR